MNERKQIVLDDDIKTLLKHFVQSSHRASKDDAKGYIFQGVCEKLFAADYTYSVVLNLNGELCCHYPYKVCVLDYENSSTESEQTSREQYEPLLDVNKLKQLFWTARSARCRARFVTPVLLYKGKQICRSGTLATGVEMFGRRGIDFFLSSDSSTEREPKDDQSERGEWPSHDRIRGQDIKLLKYLNIRYICDLMVEKKKVKYGMRVASSEKVDKENRYSEFCLVSLPYPGCEFFKNWKENGYSGRKVFFDWNQSYVDADLDIPPHMSSSQGVDWTVYKEWNLLTLTKNYLKLLLKLLNEGTSGILIHCISGWDRTPLFISLLRLSLWADGVIHKSLNVAEILYLTISYDWYLFGHALPERMGKGEEIFLFCFHFLEHMGSADYSLLDPSDADIKNNDPASSHPPGGSMDPEGNLILSAPPSESENWGVGGEINQFIDKGMSSQGKNRADSSHVIDTSNSTSPSGPQVFLSEGMQIASYIPNKHCEAARNGSTSESSHLWAADSQRLPRRAFVTNSSCFNGMLSQTSHVTTSEPNPDSSYFTFTKQVHVLSLSQSSREDLGDIRHKRPTPATQLRDQRDMSSRASRLESVRQLFFDTYNKALAENQTMEGSTRSLLSSFGEGFGF